MLDSVTINQLRTFVAVSDEASFSGAARKLNRAQSAVSHAISALEGALDVPLFERSGRRPELTPAGRGLLADARAVIARTEEMKHRARSIAQVGAPQVNFAVDAYFPRSRLVSSLQELQRSWPTASVRLRMTTMQGGEKLVLAGICSFAVTIGDVPELDPSAIERHWLCASEMVTVCAPCHPLAQGGGRVAPDELTRYVQLVVTDNQPDSESARFGVAGERNWFVDDVNTKLDLLLAGLGWGHMPVDLVCRQVAAGDLVEIQRHAWRVGPISFMISRRRGHEPSLCELLIAELLAGRIVEGDLP